MFRSAVGTPQYALHLRSSCWLKAARMPWSRCRSAAYGHVRQRPPLVLPWPERLSAVFLQVSPAGHCPHAETPAAVSEAMQMWICAAESDMPLPLEVGECRSAGDGDLQLMSGRPRNVFERLDALAWNVRKRFWQP